MSDISPHALVSSEAKIGSGVKIGHFAIIEDDVVITEKGSVTLTSLDRELIIFK